MRQGGARRAGPCRASRLHGSDELDEEHGSVAVRVDVHGLVRQSIMKNVVIILVIVLIIDVYGIVFGILPRVFCAEYKLIVGSFAGIVVLG